VSTLSPDAATPVESTLYLVLRGDRGLSTAGAWHGLGMRGNASAPMTLEDLELPAARALTPTGKGLDMMLGVVLPTFQVGAGAVALGIAEAAVQATVRHLTSTRFEHMNTSLADLPTLRARLAQMRIETDRARAHLVSVLDSLEAPGPSTQLLVLEAKAAATEAAVSVTEAAMRTCGGAAFGGALGIERMFRDARAPIVMAPTSDQAYEFIGRALCGMEVF
jgi:alkylation response protein AidB-like acyl-CoA dehydrogenase